jgi:hypothetical protein
MVGGVWRPMTEVAALVDVFARTYKRDKDGRFGSGGEGVRESLAGAKNTTEVATVLADELTATMGRPVAVDLKGMNVDVAREHAEGILRVADQFPGNELGTISTFGRRGAVPAEEMGPSSGAHAVTRPGPDGSRTDAIYFNVDIQPAVYRRKLAKGSSAPTGPMGVAVHEMGHVVTIHNGSITQANRIAERSADAAGEDFFDHIGGQISKYAASSEYEMTAEGFTKAFMHGSEASQVSRDIYDAVVQANR